MKNSNTFSREKRVKTVFKVIFFYNILFFVYIMRYITFSYRDKFSYHTSKCVQTHLNIAVSYNILPQGFIILNNVSNNGEKISLFPSPFRENSFLTHLLVKNIFNQ